MTDTMVREIRGVLSLGDQTGGWRVPIVKTEAARGEGVEELSEKIAEHREFIEAEGTLAERRRRNLMNEVMALAAGRLQRRLEESLAEDESVQELLDRVVARRDRPQRPRRPSCWSASSSRAGPAPAEGRRAARVPRWTSPGTAGRPEVHAGVAAQRYRHGFGVVRVARPSAALPRTPVCRAVQGRLSRVRASLAPARADRHRQGQEEVLQVRPPLQALPGGLQEARRTRATPSGWTSASTSSTGKVPKKKHEAGPQALTRRRAGPLELG